MRIASAPGNEQVRTHAVNPWPQRRDTGINATANARCPTAGQRLVAWVVLTGKALLVFIGCAVMLALTSMGITARVWAQPIQALQPDLVNPAPIQASGPATPGAIEPSGRVDAAPIQPAGRVGGPRIEMAPSENSGNPENPALQAELSRLRATAARVGPRGSATARNAARASWVLGLLYLHGKGLARDTAQAQIWFERARNLGEPMASAGLAWCAIEGCATAPDPAAALPWIAQLRTVDAPRANYLEWLAESRLAPLQVAQPSLRQANPAGAPNKELLVRAANGGSIGARVELGLESVAARRIPEAMAQFRQVAPRSEAAAANLALLQQHTGAAASSTPSPAPPASLAPPAGPAIAPGPGGANNAVVVQGSTGSASELLASARRYHRGEGVPANYVEAIRLYRLAESRGSQEARRMLALIASRPDPRGQIDVAWMQQLGNIDLTREVPQIDSTAVVPLLRRDPTALYDLLPAQWRRQSSQLIR